MRLQLARSSQASNFPKETIPYTSAAMRQDLERLGIWDRLPSQPRPQRHLWLPQRRLRLGGLVDGGRPGSRAGAPRSPFAAAESV